MTSPTYDPTSGPVDPDVEQPDPRLGQATPSGTFADSEVEDARTESSGERYGRPVSSGSGGGSTVVTAKGEAANVKDTAVEVKGRVGPGGVEGILVTFERPVG